MLEKDITTNSDRHDTKHFFKSVRFKFIFWFLIISLVPLLIIGTVAYFYGRSIVAKKVYEHLGAVNDSRKEHIKTFLNAKKGRTIDFSSDGLIRDITKKFAKGLETQQQIEKNKKILNTHLANNKVLLDEDIFETFVINLNGKIISSSNEESIDTDVSNSDYFEEGKKGVFVSQIYHVPDVTIKNPQVSELSLSDGKDFIAVAAPLKDKITQDLIGVFVNKVDKYALDRIVERRNGLGETGNIYLVDKNKLLITKCRYGNHHSAGQVIDTVGIRNCLSGNDGTGIYNGCCINITVVGAYAWLEEPGWALVTEMDVDEAFAPTRKVLNLIILVAIPMFSIIIGISYIISRRISNPIISITDAIKRITSGEFEHKITVSTEDELGQISAELNKVSSVIEESYKKLLHSERLASVGRITAGVAHEVNNPLSVLSGRLQLLIEKSQDNDLSDEYKKLLGLTNRIEKTVDGLLYFSRQKDMNLTSEDINSVIEDSISLVEEQMHVRGIKIIKKYGSNLPPVNISSDQIQQAFFNIILNAYDSMNNKGILKICTKLSDNGKSIQISFEDTGSGISDKDIRNIFEPFFTTKPPHKGTGLGLSISYGIIKNHNGSIKVESEEGKGAAFTVNLPVA